MAKHTHMYKYKLHCKLSVTCSYSILCIRFLGTIRQQQYNILITVIKETHSLAMKRIFFVGGKF